MGGVNSRICPMVHKNFHETVCFVCTTLGCVLLIHSCLYGKHTLVKKTKKETVPLTQLLFYSVTLCHTLLIPVSCSLSNHRLFLKLACSYLLSFSSYSYSFSNCSCYFLLPMVLFCFYFIGFFFYCFLVFSSCTRGHFVLDDLCPCEVLVPLFYHWLHWFWCYLLKKKRFLPQTMWELFCLTCLPSQQAHDCFHIRSHLIIIIF